MFRISLAHQKKIHNLRYCTSEWCWTYWGVIVFLAKMYIMIFNSCSFICCIIFTLTSDLLLAAGFEEFALEISTIFWTNFPERIAEGAEKTKRRKWASRVDRGRCTLSHLYRLSSRATAIGSIRQPVNWRGGLSIFRMRKSAPLLSV